MKQRVVLNRSPRWRRLIGSGEGPSIVQVRLSLRAMGILDQADGAISTG
jgi:hypothetical protein